ncbi:MAG: hypothetical protein ACKVU4_12390 [Phycisphaerales bacterium]
MKTRRRALGSVLAPVTVLLLAGCQGYDAGGPMVSIDQHTFESKPDYPQTVTLLDHTTGETLWSVDIPVGRKLVMRFETGKNKLDPERPDLLLWDLMEFKVEYERLDNSMPVPPEWRRMLSVSYRKPGAASGTP